MARSKASTLQSAASPDVTLGEAADTIRSHKIGLIRRTTRKTTQKTTNHTTKGTQKACIFASVKNLIRLFLRILIFQENMCNSIQDAERNKKAGKP